MDSRPFKIQRRIDRISEFPDHILCKILRLLPTKNAFAATILSTKWKNLFPIWDLSTPVILDLDDSDRLRPDGNGPLRDNYFVNFVDKLFNTTLRNVHFVETMTLKCEKRYPDDSFGDKVLSWVSAAVRLNVRELRLKCDLYDVLPLFESLDGCSKLTLELKGDFNFCYNGSPAIKTNKLKTLSLCNIVFGWDDISEGGMMETLYYYCPQLEELSLIDCDLQSLGSDPDEVLIKFPRLRTLIIRNSLRPSRKVKIETRNLRTLELLNVLFDAETEEDVNMDESGAEYLCQKVMTLFYGFPVLEELSLTNCDWQRVPDFMIDCQILKSLIIRNSLGSSDRLTLNTPNLQLLLLNDCITNYNFVRPFNSLRSADIDVGPSEKQLATVKTHNGDNEPSYYKCVRSLVRYCSDTRHLYLSTRSIEVLCQTPIDLPAFHNLALLKLGCLCRSGWKVLARLLCSAPYLEKLVFEKGFDECEGGCEEFESVVSTLPICLKYNLKEIDFLEFNDVKDGFKLIEYFLKNGEVIRKLKLQCRSIQNRNSLNTLLELSKQMKVVISFASWKDEMLLEDIRSLMGYSCSNCQI